MAKSRSHLVDHVVGKLTQAMPATVGRRLIDCLDAKSVPFLWKEPSPPAEVLLQSMAKISSRQLGLGCDFVDDHFSYRHIELAASYFVHAPRDDSSAGRDAR